MKITFYQRRPLDIHYSLEQIFESVRHQLSKKIQPKVWVSPYYSKGFWSRLKMIRSARKSQGQINHITGDIHFIALGLNKKKTILTIHDLGILNNTHNPILRWLLKMFWITLPVKCVEVVTVVSEATKKDLLRITNVNADKIKVIGNFLPDSYSYSPKEFNSIQPIILHIGSAYNKNLDRLIEAIKNIRCHLVIVGFPTEQQKSMIFENNISHEILSGLTEVELINEYKRCDILSFVSLLEGFGLPILEAQAIGRPVVTSNISSMPEVAGHGACYVDPFNEESIRNGIKKIIDDDNYRNSIINSGLKNVKKYSLHNVANQYLQLYKEVYEAIKMKSI